MCGFFQKVLDGFLNIYRMRTSPAVPGVSADAGGQVRRKKFSKLLDGELGVLHNLASLLQTDLVKRRGD